MKILAVNVNTTAAMTEQIADAARAVVREGTEIVGVTPRVGAESVEGNFESYLCAVAVMLLMLSFNVALVSMALKGCVRLLMFQLLI